MADFAFDRVVVLQSLQPHEFKSGTELKLYLEGLSEDSSHPIPIELYEFSDLIGFKQQLLVLRNSIESGQHPILHLEMHGLADASGLVFSDNSKITWSDLQPILAELNMASGLNLLVCVATCFGGHSLSMVNPTSPSPCFAIIGPIKSISGPELLQAFRGFYRILFESLDAKLALKELLGSRILESGFIGRSSEEWYLYLAKRFLEGYCKNHETGQELDAADSDKEDLNALGFFGGRDQLNREKYRNFTSQIFNRFFMVDDIPDCAQRFESTRLEAERLGQQFFLTHSEVAVPD